MRENNLKRIDVLGINLCNSRPDKAVTASLEAMRGHGLTTIFFLSAMGSLYCQETPWAKELVNSHDLVFPGDRHTEMTVQGQLLSGENGSGDFAKEYLKKFFARMNKENRELFVVCSSPERLEAIREYFKERYPDISIQSMVYEQDMEGASDKVVNEINAHIPDVVLLLLSAEEELMFIRDYETMMNADLCICMDSTHSYITERTKDIPSWIGFLHLDWLYLWLHKENRLESRIAGSIFKKRVNENN